MRDPSTGESLSVPLTRSVALESELQPAVEFHSLGRRARLLRDSRDCGTGARYRFRREQGIRQRNRHACRGRVR